MKLRTILIVLSLLAFLSASAGGYIHYTFLKKIAYKDAERQTALHAIAINNRISAFLNENLDIIKTLVGLSEIKAVFIDPSPQKIENAHKLLDHFQKTLEVSVCYLMDKTGTTLASTNRNEPDSFLGANYSFRPYFKHAIGGTPYMYMALGITSGKRGLYCSYPVYVENSKNPIGVAVIKAPMEDLENRLLDSEEKVWLLTDENGVIFATNQKRWLFQTVWKLDPQQLIKIAKSRQFGKGPWRWTGLHKRNESVVEDRKGNAYLYSQVLVNDYPDWKIISLMPIESVHQQLSAPFVKTSGYVILLICSFVGVSVSFLYRKASASLRQQQIAERKIQAYQNKLRSMSSELVLAEERERRQIATELHDRIGQTLAMQKIKLGQLQSAVKPVDLIDEIKEIRHQIEQTIQDTRSLTFELSPPVLYEFGLVPAIEWLADHLELQHGLIIDIRGEKYVQKLDLSIRILLFQAVRELLINVIKHSKARYVKISIQTREDFIQISVADNGIGFNNAESNFLPDKHGGFGLFSIHERLGHLGGRFDIRSTPGKGTCAVLYVPVSHLKKEIQPQDAT